MHRIENSLKELLLQDVKFTIDNKVVKNGKIKILNTKHFFIKFKLQVGNDIKEYELPYPYKIVKIDNGVLFDYCLSAFIPNTEEVYWKLKTFNKDECSKLHDKYLKIVW